MAAVAERGGQDLLHRGVQRTRVVFVVAAHRPRRIERSVSL